MIGALPPLHPMPVGYAYRQHYLYFVISACILKVMMLLLMLKNQPFSRSEDKNSSHFVFVSLVKAIVLSAVFSKMEN
jgi:hypothetical protein